MINNHLFQIKMFKAKVQTIKLRKIIDNTFLKVDTLQNKIEQC
jgi:hypothetical protein